MLRFFFLVEPSVKSLFTFTLQFHPISFGEISIGGDIVKGVTQLKGHKYFFFF